MVLKPFTHLARQSFAKAFTHGYAQSVVAASQSSYASSTTLNQLATHPAKFTRTSQLQSVLQNASGSSGAGAKASQANSGPSDFGLAAYYAAWQKAQQTGDDSDWKQFQFKRRIGWKPSSKDDVDETKSADEPPPTASTHSPHLTKASVNEDVSAKVEEAVAREIEIQEEQAKAEEEKEASAGSNGDVARGNTELTSEEAALANTAVEQSQNASERIVQLVASKSYSDIPVAFQTLLKEGLVPTVGAYNALLIAAVQLHVEASEAIPKALDVYSDMLRRRVIPDGDTYKILVQLLVSRAYDIIAAKQLLEQERMRYGGMEEPGKFMLHSSELERDLLAEDHSLSIAVKLFTTATARHADLVFPLEMYRRLITACAAEGEVEDMIRVYEHMEMHKVIPHASIFPSMIDAFASTGDLKSAVECYNEYRTLAISDDQGVLSVVERLDGQVYAALVRAYLSCGKEEGAMRFFDRVRASFEDVAEDRETRLAAIESVIVDKALVEHLIKTGEFGRAYEQAETKILDSGVRNHAMARICMAAADAGNLTAASNAYDYCLTANADGQQGPAISLLALHIRQGNVSAARQVWSVLTDPSSSHATPEMVQPTAMYAVALVKSGQVDEGLSEARSMFSRIRDTAAVECHDGAGLVSIREQINEVFDLLGRVLMQEPPTIISPQAAMAILWSMVENGAMVPSVVQHAISSLGPAGIAQLDARDLTLALQVQAGMLVNNAMLLFDVAHPIRFTHMLDLALTAGIALDANTIRVVDAAVARLLDSRPDMVKRWQDYLTSMSSSSSSPPVQLQSFSPERLTPVLSDPSATSLASSSSSIEDSFDPYAHSTDFRGSSAIAEELESSSGRPEAHLHEALARLRSMRRVGRHPRYITYAKLISAAARHGRRDLVNDVLAMAQRDMPLIPHYHVVKYGWVSILDAMVAACLTLGDRNQAARHHQELLDLGSAPSANTFGLYITTLKESTKTFDEATEALKIFQRAVAEGVEPTSFLYNALIGKLGKARRIDDCLLYFAEMRANGVRPTSVTYGTIVNALCRVSDERFAEEMFEEMEAMPNYKPRPAPYNSIIQYFLNTKRDRSKVLAYYERMQARNIQPTMHTYKLLIDAHASLEPVDMDAAEEVLNSIRRRGQRPEAVHYASLIHAKGCVQHDLDAARKVFDSVVSGGSSSSSSSVRPQPCLYQALFEAMVANRRVADTASVLEDMARSNVEMTAYIANTLIHGWAAEGNIHNAKAIYDSIGRDKREPSTYEAMTRAFLATQDRASASRVVQEMLSRGYPAAVAGKIVDLVSGGASSSN